MFPPDCRTKSNHNIPVANIPFENVTKFKYLGITVTNQSCIHEEIESKLNSENACFHCVQIFTNLTSSFTLKEEHGLRVSENRVLRKILHLIGRQWRNTA